MKKFLLFCFVIGTAPFVKGQITNPITKANFGIEADLSSNFFNNASQPAGDDWYSNGYTGTGQFVIDTSGAAAIVSAYATNIASRKWSFSRLMRQAPYSIVNNRLLLDAIFHRDFHGDDSTVFASGSNKNGMSPVSWSCPVSQGIPDKNDILDAFTHVRRAGPNATDSLWMFGGISIENTTGSRYFDFELYQTDIVYNRTTQTFSGYGPDAGHTSWTFDAAGNIKTPGDIIFTAEFGSAALTLVEARIWINNASLSITPTTFSWGGSFDGASSGATFGYANIKPKTAGAFYTGIQNTVDTWTGPFSLVRDNNSLSAVYIPKQFMEFSVNLTKLGIEPTSFSNNACGSPFRRVLIKTRASTSFTAELKDFIAPFKMFDYPQVDANAFINYYCEAMPSTTINVYNPVSTSVYTWTTANGNIVGSTTGTSITVNAPGTYYVTQQLHAQCPLFARDSVPILFDAICAVLKVDLTGFKATMSANRATLSWQVNNNELVAYYLIEYSKDNRVFNELVTIPANDKTGIAQYSYEYLLKHIEAGTVYYRVKMVGKTNLYKYSSIAVLRNLDASVNKPLIFPNPSQGLVQMSLESSETEVLNLLVWDITGRIIATRKIPVTKGYNLLPVYDFKQQSGGMYIIKIRGMNGETTKKIVVKNI